MQETLSKTWFLPRIPPPPPQWLSLCLCLYLWTRVYGTRAISHTGTVRGRTSSILTRAYNTFAAYFKLHHSSSSTTYSYSCTSIKMLLLLIIIIIVIMGGCRVKHLQRHQHEIFPLKIILNIVTRFAAAHLITDSDST